MARFIKISPGYFVRSDVIAVVQFKRDHSGDLVASIVTTLPSAQGTAHYDVHDPNAIAELEAMLEE